MGSIKEGARYKYVMLIDDNEIDIFINSKMLEGCNFSENIYTHTSGSSALEFLRNIEKTGKSAYDLFPEVIFLDLNMPLMDGFQFLEEYKQLAISSKIDTKVILLTATEDEAELNAAKGVDKISNVFIKPLREETIARLLENPEHYNINK